MGSGGLVEAVELGQDANEIRIGVHITVHYGTLRGESEPKPQCFKTLISHLRGFESGAKVA